MDFKKRFKNYMLDDIDEIILNPFAVKLENGEWKEGGMMLFVLEREYGNLNTFNEMMEKTEDEGMKKFLEHYKDKGLFN